MSGHREDLRPKGLHEGERLESYSRGYRAAPSINFYSSHSIFGYDNYKQYREHLINTNFHAKLLDCLCP